MVDLQTQMNSVLQNPEMMQKIMAMAQSLNAASVPETETPKPETSGFEMPDIDLGMIQKLSGLAGQANIDNDQRTLLKALTPYLSHNRIHKLEKAMRAARMAGMASVIFGKSAPQFLSGR